VTRILVVTITGLIIGGVLGWTVLNPLRRRLNDQPVRWQDKAAMVCAGTAAAIYVGVFVLRPLFLL
jgi:hypothetical protein